MEPVMEREQVSMTSTKTLVKRIVAVVCFPSVLKLTMNDKELDRRAVGTLRPQKSTKSVRWTTVLNSWRARFSSILSQGNKVKKEGKEIKILPEDPQDSQLKTQGEEVLSKKNLQEACQDHKRKMDGLVAVSSTLPEDLVERILAMVPFPYLFKARMLSKSWLARSSPISSQDDEVKQQLAISFQKKVSEWSTNWKTFCPIILDRWKGNFLAYDRTLHRFLRLPSLSFLPKTLLEGHPIEAHDEIDGAILLLSWFPHQRGTPLRSHNESWKHILYLANFLTRSWKQLPSCPVTRVLDQEGFRLHFHCRFKKLVSQALLGTYKVIVFYTAAIVDECSYFLAQIYDSKSNAWRSKSFVKKSHTLYCDPALRPVYLNGVVYMLLTINRTGLWAFNVQEETFEELVQLEGCFMSRGVYGLVVCDNNLLMILAESNELQVLKIDLTLLRLLEVARGPPAALNVVAENITKVFHNSDGDCLCFSTKESKGMVVYNVREHEWSYFSFPPNLTDVTSINYYKSLTFQPNLNTFLVV